MMSEERRKELEPLLKGIREKKEEYYIGTKEALELIRGENEIIYNPEIIARRINEELQSEENLTYLATPKRVFGLDRALYDVFTDNLDWMDVAQGTVGMYHLDGEDELNYDKYKLNMENALPFILTSEFEEFQFLEPIEIYGREIRPDKIESKDLPKWKNSKIDPERIADKLTPLFIYANRLSVTKDSEFKEVVVGYLRSQYDTIKNRLEIYLVEPSSQYIEKLIDKFSRIDWDGKLSKNRLEKRQRELLEENERENVDLGNMIDRVIRDQVDHKLDYKRMVLSKWLRDNEVTSYDEAVSLVGDNGDKGDSFGEEMIEELAKRDISGDSYILQGLKDLNKRLIRRNQFLRRLVKTERDFIEKFLRS